MNTSRIKVFGTGLMLAMMMAPFAVFSQDMTEADDDLMPAVDTSAAAASISGNADREDAVEPATDSPLLAQDITRRTTGSQVMDSMELDRTEITGNQELPKVLHIVPWQKSDPGDLMGKPVNTLPVSYTHLTLPTKVLVCRSRWSPYH